MAEKIIDRPIEPAIYAHSRKGRRCHRPPAPDVPVRPLDELLPPELRRTKPPALPEVDEPTLVRHYVRLSRLNYCIDVGFYPLGSCTMKYNPKMADAAAALPGINALHPLAPEGMLQPAIKMIRAYHKSRGNPRKVILVPDSAHGTNPASGTMCSYDVVVVASDKRGNVSVESLKEKLSDDVAALMLTNPNTLGLFEENILEVAELVHRAGGQLYYDGANFNAILGRIRPGDMGFDAVHLNLHKTFGTPHGGGGPGAGPVGVKKHLAEFLPVPTVEETNDGFRLDYDRPRSIGKLLAFYGHFLVSLRAYVYIRHLGLEGLRGVSVHSVLNANYLQSLLKDTFLLPFDRLCMHEFVLSGNKQKEAYGVATLDISKRIIDYGFHPPTNYFPQIVPEALMIEPTETETRQTLDAFAAALLAIDREAAENPDLLHGAPYSAPVRRVDEARAVRELNVSWPEGE
ncbi:MAG: aminomethyl-transferring glycine dehydrogenase subunit GcvPB [bacterium]|nr:aminomethyl-transferring glycine dehydrogenase subunit GcvPB [bacterium]